MNNRNLLPLLRDIKEQYYNHFDQTWFHMLLENCPVSSQLTRDIRIFLDSGHTDLTLKSTVIYGISNLETFIRAVETYLLPHIKELLGVSGLAPSRKYEHRDEFVHRRLLAEVLPYNLTMLKVMVNDLKAAAETCTPPVLPELPVFRTA